MSTTITTIYVRLLDLSKQLTIIAQKFKNILYNKGTCVSNVYVCFFVGLSFN